MTWAGARAVAEARATAIPGRSVVVLACRSTSIAKWTFSLRISAKDAGLINTFQFPKYADGHFRSVIF